MQGIGEEAGAALTAHPGVDRIAFTGSVPTGKLVASSAAANLTPASLELGGKSPFVAFADADLDAVVQQAVNQFDNAGQVCLAGTRLIVERTMHDEFLERFTEAAGAIVQGDPRDDGDRHRPADHPRALRAGRRVRAAREGRRRRRGVRRRPERGSRRSVLPARRCSPDAPEGSEILTQEVFGPVLTLQTFDDEDEAIALANSTEYGLAAIVYTGDEARAERVSSRLVAGTVWVNCFFVRDLAAPFGGARGSGIGREGGAVELRLLRGRQERLHRTVELTEEGPRWVKSSARRSWRTSPRSCCPRRPGARSTTARRSRSCRACAG